MNDETERPEQKPRFEWRRIVEVDVSAVEAVLGRSYKYRADEWAASAKARREPKGVEL